MKIFGINFGAGNSLPANASQSPRPVAVLPAVRSRAARLDAALLPTPVLGVDAPHRVMSYRAVFEMVIKEALKSLRLGKEQVTFELLRVRAADDTPRYQVVMVAHVKTAIALETVLEFHRVFHSQLKVVSQPAFSALTGVSWTPSAKLISSEDFQPTDVMDRAPFPGQQESKIKDIATSF